MGPQKHKDLRAALQENWDTAPDVVVELIDAQGHMMRY